ncbi:TonB-dependent receptor [Desulfobacula sp.]|uniref:TonB-dependent receptor plug domain-containing protein n=1 Tax=Desulfobacula sp. TaxID=2593537 RepID=UPI00262F22CE|nr:TonB-dependent receptor [Desulfobacula sp.]
MNKIVIILCASILFLLNTVCLANQKQEDASTVRLDDIVVTATRKESSLKDAPASVTIIDQEEIKGSTADTADELLRNTAGIDIMGSHRCDSRGRQVSLRGVSDQGKTLILVDGVPVNGNWHGWVEWGQIPTDNIERIEIVRGPSSSLYGSSAMGGVINFITKKPEKPFEAVARISYGSLNTRSTYFNVGGKNGRFGYGLSGKYATTDGYVAAKEEQPYNIMNDYENSNFDSRLSYDFDEISTLSLNLSHSQSNIGRGTKYSNFDREINRGNITFNRDIKNGLGLRFVSYIHNEDWDVEFDKPPFYNYLNLVEDFDVPTYGASMQASYPLVEWNILTAGFEFKQSGIDKKGVYQTVVRFDQTKGKQRYYSLYLQDEAAFFNDSFLVNLGARQDWFESYDGSLIDTNPLNPIDISYDDKSWDSFNPKLGLVYHATGNTTLRASIGKAFQAPSLPRLYTYMLRGPKQIWGNPDLKPETMISYEVGLDHNFFDNLLVKLTLYEAQGDDFISTRTIGVNKVQFDNISEVQMRGIEAELRYDITDEISCQSSYTFNESTIEKNDVDQSVVGNNLSYTPENKFSLGVIYNNPDLFKADVRLRYTDEMYVDQENSEETRLDDYWTVDIKITKEIFKHAEFSLECENLLDKGYDISDLYKTPGRLISASLTVKF